MHAVDIVQERTDTVPAGVAAPRPRGALDHQLEPPAPSLPVHVLVPTQPRWEQILVGARLDRESREGIGGEL